ncbi:MULTISPECIES: hypothetical protein [Rhodococcus]|uniref:hypothetical protein n=1 Tax=Rhodococcus TaxID=1827 RepID=UPI0018782DB1|nr:MULTISPECIES: hypothetical protein [Rhodococcus]MDJ0441184.1 hypothetical protein [Rhodococcus qingshengii]QOS66375.1 hypothetical protein IM699_29945 [Rhodococcus qingshengii]
MTARDGTIGCGTFGRPTSPTFDPGTGRIRAVAAAIGTGIELGLNRSTHHRR